jgi:hypothetical protein
MKLSRIVIPLVALALLLSTQVRASELVRTHPDLASKIRVIQNVLLLPPSISMFEIGAGDTPEKMEDWGTAAQQHVVQAMETRAATFHLTQLDEQSLDKAARDNYDETRLLYEVVGGSISLHTFDENRPWHFPEKAREFVYSLGSEIQKLAPQADAFLLVKGFDQRSSGGRKALHAGRVLIGAALGVIHIPRSGANLITVALVEAKTGTILWFYRTLYPYDLREATEASLFVEDVLKEFPTIGK